MHGGRVWRGAMLVQRRRMQRVRKMLLLLLQDVRPIRPIGAAWSLPVCMSFWARWDRPWVCSAGWQAVSSPPRASAEGRTPMR